MQGYKGKQGVSKLASLSDYFSSDDKLIVKEDKIAQNEKEKAKTGII